MRQYAGNWASALWAFARAPRQARPDRPATRNQVRQLEAMGYPPAVAEITMQQTIAWRSMHSQGRGLFSLLINHIPDIDTWTVREGEFACNSIIGFNFGDGHLHDASLIRAIQRRCTSSRRVHRRLGRVAADPQVDTELQGDRRGVGCDRDGHMERRGRRFCPAWLPDGPIPTNVTWRQDDSTVCVAGSAPRLHPARRPCPRPSPRSSANPGPDPRFSHQPFPLVRLPTAAGQGKPIEGTPMTNSTPIADRVAVVTGAGAGLGAAIVRRLAADGARVVVSDIDIDAARGVADTIDGAIAVEADVTDENQIKALVEQTVDHFAAPAHRSPQRGSRGRSAHRRDVLRRLATHHRGELDGVFLTIRHTAPAIAAAGGGSIVTISSITATAGSPLIARMQRAKPPYATSRDGGHRVPRSRRPSERGATRIHRHRTGHRSTAGLRGRLGLEPGGFDELMAAKQGRYGTPDEVAAAVAFFRLRRIIVVHREQPRARRRPRRLPLSDDSDDLPHRSHRKA